MPRIISLFSLLFLTLFVFVELAEARLIRNSGRGVLSEQVQTNIIFVPQSDIVEFFDGTFGMSVDAYDNRFDFLTRTVGGGGNGISAVPTSPDTPDTDCNGSYFESDIEFLQEELDFLVGSGADEADIIAAEDAIDQVIEGTPCSWEFEQGEDLFAFGFFSVFFDIPEVTTTVTWRITGGGIDETIIGTASAGRVELNAPAPNNLAVGNYKLSVSALLSTPNNSGEFLLTQSNTGSGSSAEVVRLQAMRDEFSQDIIGYRSENDSGEFRTAPSSFFSFQEDLKIVAASNDPGATPVNAPASLMFVFFGFLGLCLQRYKCKV